MERKEVQLREVLAGMIRRAFQPCAAKVASRYAEASHRTVEAWLQAKSTMNGAALLLMCRNEAFRSEIRAWCDQCERQDDLPPE